MRRVALIAVAATVALAACGGDDEAATGTTDAAEISLASIAPPTTAAKPEVELPAEAPTELATTVITEGTGIEAAAGDGVLVRYVGVSFETGEEFDSNFNGGEPLPVILGEGRVIAGWDEGLIGVQAGERLQLDIPADMAYGPTPTDTTTPGSDAPDATAETTVASTDETTAATDETTAATGDTTATTAGGSDATTETSDPAATTGATDATTSTTVAVPQGPPTGPLSFVVDVLAVVQPTDAADAPAAGDIPTLCPRPVIETTVPETTIPDTTGPDTTPETSVATTNNAANGWRSPASADTATTESTDATASTATDATATESTETDSTETDSTGTALNGTCDVHVDEVVTDDITVGDGPTASLGQIGIIHFVLARADNGVVLRSSWDDGQPTQLALVPGVEMSGMITGIDGMQVGGRRVITVPYMEAFGARGFPTAGLPAETDVVVVVDLLGVYT